MLRYLMLFLLLSLSTSCTTDAFKPTYNIQRKNVPIVVSEVKGLSLNGSPLLGRAVMVKGVCYIALREYPTCLQHEVRHCLEGAWHGKMKNDDDCFVD